jgi:CDP-paratose 2-epimerase
MGHNTVLITGAGGLVGSAITRKYLDAGFHVVGFENDMRKYLFGKEGSIMKSLSQLQRYDDFKTEIGDVRAATSVNNVMKKYRPGIIIHTAAQPSHDWAAGNPQVDFGINAVGTLNVLQAAREYCIDSPFCHISTSKVYGDTPNRLPLEKTGLRFEPPEHHKYWRGIDTSMSIDNSLHSLFGVSKAAGDLLVQEYGRYFDMPTICLRPGCVTGPNHSAVELHGFLSYLMKCCATGKEYTIYGYDGLQVRCNIHADDLARACMCHAEAPGACGLAYNIGGGRKSACSMLEAINICENITGKKMNYTLVDEARIGDHKWWISDNDEFQFVHEEWKPEWSVRQILEDIYDGI